MAGQKKTRKLSVCDHCGVKTVFSSIGRIANHLSGDPGLCTHNGGMGACTDAPAAVMLRFKNRVLAAKKAVLNLQARVRARKGSPVEQHPFHDKTQNI